VPRVRGLSTVTVRRLHPDAHLPAYSTEGDAGADLTSVAEVTLAPGERALVPRHGVTVVNAPGTIDSGYRGEVHVNLVNLDPRESFTVRVGDRIAQLVVQHYLHANFEVADSLPGSTRGETGHGSTGGFGPNEPA
jgi:dUTP pyrophosphatase